MTQYVYEIDMRAERDYLLKKYRAARAELTQARAELKDLQVANRVCEKRLEHQTHTHNFWFKTCLAAERERDQIRQEVQEQSDEVQEHWLSPCQKAGLESLVETLRGRLKHAEDIRNFWIKEHDDLLQTIRRERQVAKATMVELKRVHRAAHMEAEGLRRQLKHAEGAHTYRFKEYDVLEIDLCHAAEGEAAIVEAAEAYLAQRKHRHLVMDEDCKNLQDVLEHRSDAAAKLLERLATLDAAEAALADCNLGGVETKFNGLPNAIEEMAEHIKELSGQLSEAELAAHIHNKSCAELAQTVRTEQARRREAEQETRRCNIALSAARAEAKATQTLLDNASAELSNGHRTLTLAGIPRSDEFGKLSITGRAIRLRQRAERAEALETAETALIAHINELDGRLEKAEQCAEALAALVTPELERLLEKLASHTQELAGAKIDIYAEPLEFRIRHWLSDARVACELAAQIRAALALEVNDD